MLLVVAAPLEGDGKGVIPPLPEALTNNAVGGDGVDLFSFLGLDQTRVYRGISRHAYRYEGRLHRWRRIRDLPVGRLAATAQVVNGKVVVFGGYTVDAAGNEVTTANVDIYDPRTDTYASGAPMPVPVDDAVSGVWRGRLVFLVSGWSQKGNVSNVQIYDPARDLWQQATPIVGTPVFGHAGGIVGDRIVYCDGVTSDERRQPKFELTDSCYVGEIDPQEPSRIAWTRLAAHPGEARYRMAAGPLGDTLVFAGGSHNPYNYNGIGYDRNPCEPDPGVFTWSASGWGAQRDLDEPSMDHRGLVQIGGSLYTVGGMREHQRVTDRVQLIDLSASHQKVDHQHQHHDADQAHPAATVPAAAVSVVATAAATKEQQQNQNPQ